MYIYIIYYCTQWQSEVRGHYKLVCTYGAFQRY
jgi:hypothetical protein